MTGREPTEPHRVATPLELLFDLTFVVGFGVAAEQLAHLLAEGHLAGGLIGFGVAMFAVCWAWINFSWFASAYDTDDWPCGSLAAGRCPIATQRSCPHPHPGMTIRAIRGVENLCQAPAGT